MNKPTPPSRTEGGDPLPSRPCDPGRNCLASPTMPDPTILSHGVSGLWVEAALRSLESVGTIEIDNFCYNFVLVFKDLIVSLERLFSGWDLSLNASTHIKITVTPVLREQTGGSLGLSKVKERPLLKKK